MSERDAGDGDDDADRGEYDFAPPTAPTASPPPLPGVIPVIATPGVQTRGPISENNSPGPPPALAYRARQDEAQAGNDPEHIKNFYMPLWLLGGGVAIEIAGV